MDVLAYQRLKLKDRLSPYTPNPGLVRSGWLLLTVAAPRWERQVKFADLIALMHCSP